MLSVSRSGCRAEWCAAVRAMTMTPPDEPPSLSQQGMMSQQKLPFLLLAVFFLASSGAAWIQGVTWDDLGLMLQVAGGAAMVGLGVSFGVVRTVRPRAAVASIIAGLALLGAAGLDVSTPEAPTRLIWTALNILFLCAVLYIARYSQQASHP